MQVTMKGDRYYPWLGVLEDMAVLSEEESDSCKDIGYYQQVIDLISKRLDMHSPSVSGIVKPGIAGEYSPVYDSIFIGHSRQGNLFGMDTVLHEYAHFLTHWSTFYYMRNLPCVRSLYTVKKQDIGWQGGLHGHTFAAFFRLTIDTFRELMKIAPIDWDEAFPEGYLTETVKQDSLIGKFLVKAKYVGDNKGRFYRVPNLISMVMN